MGAPELATLLWSKTKEPLRAAILASCVCRLLSKENSLRAFEEELLKQSTDFERLGVDLLNSVPESEKAANLLVYMPCQRGKDSFRRLLWKESSLDNAAGSDGLRSFPCMEIVAHRHAQWVLDNTFVGNFPGSRARIRQDASLFFIILQGFIGLFLPGTVVEVMAPNMGQHGQLGEPRKGGTDMTMGSVAEWDADLLHLVQSNREDFSDDGQDTGLQDSVEDVIADLKSRRFLHFYHVPKVKFALAFLLHLAYLALLCLVLLVELQDQSNVQSKVIITADWMRWDGELPNRLRPTELLLWFWTFARLVGEFNEIQSYDYDGLRLYLRDGWNMMDLTNATLVTIIVGLRLSCITGGVEGASCDELELAPRARMFYAFVVILSFLRTLQFLRYYQGIGVQIIVLFEMVPDVATFFNFILIFSFSFGVAMAVLMPGGAGGHPVYQIFDGSPMWQPFCAPLEIHAQIPNASEGRSTRLALETHTCARAPCLDSDRGALWRLQPRPD